jgi:rhodanese-related sulfurtransferase
MDFLLANWMFIAAALISGTMLALPLLRSGSGSVTPLAAVQLINRERAVVVDVSEPAEYGAGHVIGAKNVPFGQLQERLTTAVKNKTVPLILVCPTGGRSGRAVAIARKLGYDQAMSLGGGLKSWRDADLPVESA